MSVTNDHSTIFIHIPKTAGTTLRSIIEDHFPAEQLYFIYIGNASHPGMDEFLALTEAEKKQIKIFCGHQAFGFHRHLPQPCKYITVMREPVERTVSLYHHLLQEKHARHDQSVADMQRRIKSENLTLEGFVSSGITLDTDNAQTRILSGESPDFGQCGRDTLEKAKANLREHFAVAGLTERFDESVMLIHKVLGWPTPLYARKNVSGRRSHKEDIPPETLAAIRRFNALDTELYGYAQELLDEKIERLGTSFQREIEEFKIANRYFQEWFGKRNTMNELQLQLDNMTSSWSWRLTGPLRKIVGMLKTTKRF
jgi:Galactose-3-O-sulfotransferase